MLWDVVYPDRPPDGRPRRRPACSRSAARTLEVLHTPGPLPRAAAACTTPAAGVRLLAATRCSTAGPGATGRSFSDFATIIESHPRPRCSPLPPETVVHTGHGDDTTIGDEAPHLDEWIARADADPRTLLDEPPRQGSTGS